MNDITQPDWKAEARLLTNKELILRVQGADTYTDPLGACTEEALRRLNTLTVAEKVVEAARDYSSKFVTDGKQEADSCSACGARSSLSGIMPNHYEDCVLGEMLQAALAEYDKERT